VELGIALFVAAAAKAVGKPARWHSSDRRARRAPLRRRETQNASILRSGGGVPIEGAVGEPARWHSPARRAWRAPPRRGETRNASARRGGLAAVSPVGCHPGEGRDPGVETPADAVLPALDARLRGHDIGWGTVSWAPKGPPRPSVSRHVGVHPTDALGARRYEEGTPRAAVVEWWVSS